MLDIPAKLPMPANEAVLSYAPGAPERAELKAKYAELAASRLVLPSVIGGLPRTEGAPFDVVMPHHHRHVLGTAHDGGTALTKDAIAAARAAAPGWAAMPLAARVRIFQRAAELLAGPWRQTLNAATMLGQSKTCFQAEIDAACELIDFLRFQCTWATQLLEQPISPVGFRNELELRPLEGFILAITPFNFTAIAGNLPSVCALLGNVVVWKPSETQAFAAHFTMKLFEAAGLPPGVINLVHGHGAAVVDACLAEPDFAGLHFTGSSDVFQGIWEKIGTNIRHYRNYPRIVGETGGKDFVLAHASADVDALVVALVRGAFEFSGQKCSAASRAYIPRSLWPTVRAKLVDATLGLAMGDVADYRNFLGAVIHERAYDRLEGWVRRCEAESVCTVHAKGTWSKEDGYFAAPTVIEVGDPHHPLLATELFGPVLGVFVYDDDRDDEVLRFVNETSPYALTGALFARDRGFLAKAATALKHAAGNLYLNDKPTGAVVGQQPFGGARASGTNDKAGSPLNLLRWVQARTVKETFVAATRVSYPFQNEA